MNATQCNEKLLEYRKSKIKTYPCNNLRASNIGHQCERYLYLSIRNWEDKQPHDATLQAIFDLGNAIEDYAISTLKDAGFEILTPTERSWKVENPLITGREDLRIKEEDGQLYPVEVKGLAAPEWEKLNGFEDFKNSKKHYVRAYPSQLLVYMWKFNKEKGYFCLVNKQTGEIKMIQIEFDYDYADDILKKGERIYAALADNKPETLNTADDCAMCERCDFRHVCTAKKEGVEAEVDDGTIEALITRKSELEEAADEYGDINDKIKSALAGREKVIAGDWIVTVTKSERKAYAVQAATVERLNIKHL
jgi:CRISPR/Cas system-associated exonuclease Cas4 (RecB family)